MLEGEYYEKFRYPCRYRLQITMLLKTSLSIFLLHGISMTIFGLTYLFTDEFMPYHSAAIARSWAELDSSFQGLFLGFLKLGGGGSFTAGVAVLVMVCLSFRNSVSPYRLLLPLLSLGWSLVVVNATYTVNSLTPGNPPLTISLLTTVFSATASILLWVGSPEKFSVSSQQGGKRKQL